MVEFLTLLDKVNEGTEINQQMRKLILISKFYQPSSWNDQDSAQSEKS